MYYFFSIADMDTAQPSNVRSATAKRRHRCGKSSSTIPEVEGGRSPNRRGRRRQGVEELTVSFQVVRPILHCCGVLKII